MISYNTKMEEYLDIFDVLYEIKDKISDKEFRFLNERVGQLYAFAKENLNNQMQFPENNSDSESELEEESDVEEESIISQEAEESDNDIELDNFIECNEADPTHIISYCDCSDGEESICIFNADIFKSCKNYPKFIEINPILENIYEEKSIEFTKEPISRSFIVQDIVFNVNVILNLLTNLKEKNQKIWASFAIFDYLMRNIEFVKMHKKFAEKILLKCNEILEDENAIDILSKLNFDKNIWINTFKSLIDNV